MACRGGRATSADVDRPVGVGASGSRSAHRATVLALRKRNGLTVDLLADRLGGGSRTLAKIEGGRR